MDERLSLRGVAVQALLPAPQWNPFPEWRILPASCFRPAVFHCFRINSPSAKKHPGQANTPYSRYALGRGRQARAQSANECNYSDV